jgi:LysR family glycine cleavage system transcriptional activator
VAPAPFASFHEANGDVQLNLACSYEDVSFTSGYYDPDIRYGYAHWVDGEVKTLRNEFITPLASEDYLNRFPVSRPEDLLERRLIFSETPLVQLGRGSLVPVFDRTFAVEVGAHHMVYPSQNADLPRVARFLAWVDRGISRHAMQR